MSAERDELARVITAYYRAKGGMPPLKPPPELPMHAKVDEPLADAILAAGWRRPRVITTVEELDALPGGSIVAADWATHQKVLGTWVTFGGPGATTPDLPATVLFEGAA